MLTGSVTGYDIKSPSLYSTLPVIFLEDFPLVTVLVFSGWKAKVSEILLHVKLFWALFGNRQICSEHIYHGLPSVHGRSYLEFFSFASDQKDKSA